ncbi:MAG: PAS domain S-box protein [Chloroflexi bacterium]|nr:PAS domain S-box protein [Chloroflexota bacterium]
MIVDEWQIPNVNLAPDPRCASQVASESAFPRNNDFDSLGHYRYVFDNVIDAIFVHDLTGQFLQVNQAACRQLGYSRDEMLTMTVQQLHNPEAAVRFDGSMQQLLREGNLLIERSHRRKDGSFMPVEINARLIEYKGQPAVLGVVRDISERRRAEAEIEEQNRKLGELALQASQRAKQLEAITELVHIVSSARSLDEMFPVFAEQTRRLVDYDRISIILFNATTRQFIIRLVLDESGNGPRQGMAMPCDEAMVDFMQNTPQPILCPNPHAPERNLIGQRMATQMGVLTSMSLPLMIQNRFLGVLALSRRRAPNFLSADVQMLLPVAKQLAIAIENARLEEQIKVMAIREERDRLGREMHDGLGQVLGSIALRASTAVELLRQGQTERAQATMEELASLARVSCSEVREEILGLRTAGHATLELEAALREYLRHYEHEWEIACELQVGNGGLKICHLRGEAQLLRIVQEAMTNVRKHARASRVVLRMIREGESLVTTVEDDGCGFDPDVRRVDHFGLLTMRERAESVGGQFRVESAPSQGTRVIVSVPCREIQEDPR